MIDKTLSFLVTELNAHLAADFPSTEPHAILSSLAFPDGSVPDQIENKIVITIANVERETAATEPDFARPVQDGDRIRVSYPLHLNVYLLVSASYKQNYVEGLRLLSAALAFLHLKPVFTPQNSAAFPSGLQRLTLEMVNLGVTDLQNVWASMGSKYMPSAFYKARMLSIKEQWAKDRVPVIAGTDAKL